MGDKWTIAKARKHVADLVSAAPEGPQAIYRRDRLVAGMVSAEELNNMAERRQEQDARTIAAAFRELRALLAEEGRTLEAPPRTNRHDEFAESLDDLPG